MSSRISTKELIKKCKNFITSDFSNQIVEYLAKEATIQADKDLHNCDSLYPMAWDIVPYDEFRCNAPALISEVTTASTGVITAASYNSEVAGHGFHDHSIIRDIVTIDGIDGMERLNKRQFLVEYINTTTFSLKSLDGQTAINTSGYEDYNSGGAAYHSGFVLNADTILTNVDSEWTIKSLLQNVTFDGYPSQPVSERIIKNDPMWLDISSAGRPVKTRQWQHMTTSSLVEYYLFWYPVVDQAYNIGLNYQKEVPDIAAWTDDTYPFHPPEAHDAIWHGALAHLVGTSKRIQQSDGKEFAVSLEVLLAQNWIAKWEEDKNRIKKFSRKLLGASGGFGGITA